MTENHRAPRAHQVCVAIPIRVGKPTAVRFGDEPRGAADGGKRPHRGVHPTRDNRARVGKQLRRPAHAGDRLVSAAHGNQCPSLADRFNYRV
ncbi:glutamate-1-semialdehyde 2,1-aminomutase hemL domain protein [Mycobacterium ulcerans str. Harvey]|uniref:Glutamate-1-semialdehyde 2,1-aminomutase hemL domain protein n=1 Tax=Mycobacterium ulcerans str. Harvey TaxID=1299332 RepID=A0ABN0R5R6_MYCUL|nr:glutamate-1-semialdehyde 2,1-aminomutase hemL domain protein [Mycobacterium ulcerans str. Harvey]